MTRVLVTGGTGALGRVVARRLGEDGHTVRIASRHARPAHDDRPYEWSVVDYGSGDGLAAAVAGVDAVVHCASAPGGPRTERRLVEAVDAAGTTPHLVYISIVGIDRIPFAYYRTKLAGERVVTESGLPWTVLRTTQFHDLVRVLLAVLAKSPVLPVPDIRVQPVDVEEVGARLADLATGEPQGYATELGGPEVHPLRELAATYLRSTGRRRAVLPIRLPGKAFRGFHAGGNLTPDHADGTITFQEYLAGYPNQRTVHYRRAEA